MTSHSRHRSYSRGFVEDPSVLSASSDSSDVTGSRDASRCRRASVYVKGNRDLAPERVEVFEVAGLTAAWLVDPARVLRGT